MIWAGSLRPCCGNVARGKPGNAAAMAVGFGLLLLLIGAQAAGTPGAGFLKLSHRYSDSEGSSRNSGGRGMSQQYWERLLAHDQGRHGRFLIGAVDFPLGGTYDPSVAGLYYTEVGLGTPSKQYAVQVDTGSDVLWVNCKPCIGCPTKSGLGVPLSFYDPSSSQLLQCSDPLCGVGKSVSEAACTSENTCAYTFQYGDGSTAEGYYIKGAFQYEQLDGSNLRSNATTEVVFGCSFNQSGQLSSSNEAVDGIMGFGQLALSIPSQLAAQKKAPRKFAHCLDGEKSGGGILVIGDVVVTNMQYTPLVPNASHYNVNLLSIAVNSANLSIDPAEFATADSSGALFDSGTTLAYLPERAYETFVKAIVEASTSQYISYEQGTCFIVTGSLDASFPTVALNFEGASMQLGPENYLLLRANVKYSNTPIWCIGWQSSSTSNEPKDTNQLTIIGDLVMKDKLMVYDLENSQIGWVDYNCSSEVKVATSSGQSQSVGSSHINASDGMKISTARWTLLWLLFVAIAGLV